MKFVEADKMTRLEAEAAHDEAAREVLADEYEQQGRHLDAAMLRLGFPLPSKDTRPRVDVLTNEEREQMDAWAQKWIAIGLRAGATEPVEVDAFAAAIAVAYESAQLAPPKQIVWTTSPIASVHVLDDAVRDAVGRAVHEAVRVAVREAVDDAVDDAVHDAVGRAVGRAVDVAVRGLEVGDAPSIIRNNWYRYIGGQAWVGWGYGYRGPAYISFLQDVCKLQLSPDHERVARAYQVICRTCWWFWSHKEFVIVAPRPSRLELDADGQLVLAEWADGSRIERNERGKYQINAYTTY
jgi:hypothetical protein